MDPVLTVFIPTYNRPANCLHAIQSVLQCPDQDIRVIVISNSADDRLDHELKDLVHDTRLAFFHNPENIGFKGSFFRAMNMVTTNYFMFLSDEDRLHSGPLGAILDILRNSLSTNPPLGYILPSVISEDGDSYSIKHRSFHFRNKAFALIKLFDKNSYISGTIMNLNCSDIEGMKEMINHPDNWYPHIYWRLQLTMNNAEAITTDIPFVSQGKEAEQGGDAYSGVTGKDKLNPAIYGLESRIRQELFFEEQISIYKNELSWFTLLMVNLKHKINFAHSLNFCVNHYDNISREFAAQAVRNQFITSARLQGTGFSFVNRLVILSIYRPFVYRIMLILHAGILKLTGVYYGLKGIRN